VLVPTCLHPQMYTTLVASLSEYEHTKTEEWGHRVERSSESKLRLSLLTADDSPRQLLVVNFSPELVTLLREAKYFLLMGLSVPVSVMAVYKRAESFRNHAGNLELIVNMCNTMDTSMLTVERPLMKVRTCVAAVNGCCSEIRAAGPSVVVTKLHELLVPAELHVARGRCAEPRTAHADVEKPWHRPVHHRVHDRRSQRQGCA
jgi:hypothetical protein